MLTDEPAERGRTGRSDGVYMGGQVEVRVLRPSLGKEWHWPDRSPHNFSLISFPSVAATYERQRGRTRGCSLGVFEGPSKDS